MADAQKLPDGQYKVLERLVEQEGEREVEDLARDVGLDQSQVAAAILLLERRGWAAIRTRESRIYRLSKAGRETARRGLPEKLILRALCEAGGALSMKEVAERTKVEPRVVGGALPFLRERDWARQEGGRLVVTDRGRADLDTRLDAESFLEWLAARPGGQALGEDLDAAPVRLSETQLQALARVRRFIEIRTRTLRFPHVTDAGREAFAGARPRIEVSQLTPELLASGRWRDVEFKRYDVRLGVAPVVAGKTHPLQEVIDETRNVFLRMGFTEIASPSVESAFWDFDALFQPQDHPAREMQDTFYLERPDRAELPRAAGLVDRVRRAHENGGDTGSRGWQIPWSEDLARQTVLRTHTTAATVRALAAHPHGPHRVFCVGRVFRREAITFKHLPVFTQVDGIIIDDRATFASLLGTLGAFYEGMGFRHYEFRPAFFPYTEPSVEVYIYYEPKKSWVEMGGAGVFRPEVTLPLGCRAPVLAWGLGLERLAMLRHGVLHMRDLYLPDLQWLREAPKCPSSESR